jgi:hypothetical protein
MLNCLPLRHSWGKMASFINHWAHPASSSMGTEGSFLAVKRLKREAKQLPPSSVMVKNDWSYKSTRPIRHHGVHTENFYLLSLLYVICPVNLKFCPHTADLPTQCDYFPISTKWFVCLLRGTN